MQINLQMTSTLTVTMTCKNYRNHKQDVLYTLSVTELNLYTKTTSKHAFCCKRYNNENIVSQQIQTCDSSSQKHVWDDCHRNLEQLLMFFSTISGKTRLKWQKMEENHTTLWYSKDNICITLNWHQVLYQLGYTCD